MMKKYTIIVGVGITLNCILNIVFAFMLNCWFYLMIIVSIPILYLFVIKSKFFVKKDDIKINRHITIGNALNQIFLLLLGIVISISYFDNLIWYGFIACCVLSVGYTLIYMFCHENLMKMSKKYCIVYLFFTLILMFSVIAIFLVMPKTYLMIVINEETMVYDLVPFAIGGKFIIDVLLGVGLFPDIAW